MVTRKRKNKTLEIETEGLDQEQIRLLKSLNCLLQYVVKTQNESEFFSGSAEALRICASLIKRSQFIEGLHRADNVPYAEQALEYSIDVLQEYISTSKVIQYDN